MCLAGVYFFGFRAWNLHWCHTYLSHKSPSMVFCFSQPVSTPKHCDWELLLPACASERAAMTVTWLVSPYYRSQLSLVTPLDAPHRNFIIARAYQVSALFAVVTPVGLSRQGKGGGGKLRMKIVYETDDSLSNKNQPGLVHIQWFQWVDKQWKW